MDAHETSQQAFWDCIERVVVPRQQIACRVRELSAQVANAFAGQELTILAVMTGALVFLADLIRNLPIMTKLELVSARSYPGTATRSQGVKMDALPNGFGGKHVLIVDDILDSGATMEALVRQVGLTQPASLRTCVLMRKDRSDRPDRPAVDFVGFDIADEFVVGYGLDYNNLYRNLPDICVLKPHCIESELAGGQDAGG